MYCVSGVFWILIWMFAIVLGRREAFDTKCKRNCNTEGGSLDCWKATTDGFSYGLSTAMIDFCQVILKLRQLTNENETWYEMSRDILTKQVNQYELDDVRQLSKDDVKQIAMSLLDNCFNASSSTTSFEPTCSLCSETQTKLMTQWRISSIVLFSIALFLVVIIFLLFTLYTYYVRRSYASIK